MAGVTRIRQSLTNFLAFIKMSKGMDRLAKEVELLSCDDGKASFKIKVDESHLNGYGSLHGGMTATLIDIFTTAVIYSKPPHHPGISTDLSVSYLRPANVGEEITINAEVIKMGQTFAFSSAVLLNKDGKLLAKGSNTKYMGQDAPSVKKGVSL